MQQLPWPATGQRFHRRNWWGSLIFPTATALFNVVSEVSSHARPPEVFLHEGGRAALALMCRLLVATIQSGTPMPLRNYELEHNLISLPLLGLLVQEAILDQELLLCLNVGGCSLFVQHLVEGYFECFVWCPQVLGNLIEDWILLLFLFPVSDIGGGQPCQPGLHRHLLGTFLAVWHQPDSLLSMLFNGRDGVVEYSLDPRMRDLVQVLLNFFLREAFIHPTQEVGNRIVFTFLLLQGEVVACEVSHPSLPCGIQIGRGEDISEQVVVRTDYELVPVLPVR